MLTAALGVLRQHKIVLVMVFKGFEMFEIQCCDSTMHELKIGSVWLA